MEFAWATTASFHGLEQGKKRSPRIFILSFLIFFCHSIRERNIRFWFEGKGGLLQPHCIHFPLLLHISLSHLQHLLILLTGIYHTNRRRAEKAHAANPASRSSIFFFPFIYFVEKREPGFGLFVEWVSGVQWAREERGVHIKKNRFLSSILRATPFNPPLLPRPLYLTC